MVESATNSPASGVNEILSNIPAHLLNSEHAPSTSPDNQGSPLSNEQDMEIWTTKEKKSNSLTQERKVHYHGSHEGHQEDMVRMIWGKNIEERPGLVGRVEKEETANFQLVFKSWGKWIVLKELKQSEIIAVAKSLAGMESADSKIYIPFYSAAKQAIKESLMEAEIEQINNEVEWQQKEGVPKKKQAEYDTNSLQGTSGNIPSFGQYNPKALKKFTKCWIKYIKHVAALENGTKQSEKKTTFLDANIEFSKGGLPLVPKPICNENGLETNAIQIDII
ncbi:hypothetical protein CPB84DRAFT_1757190 [Gymnopilus junonius]|uniref:Uncharacterized protein n=1 Tax=Gymnopilus junonius TaxID=109634 RepID=A0A9P5TE99_GYMJU|nr:hypothetical protein CPB84DRAFT_1757190 [Gymnopilus junonius]